MGHIYKYTNLVNGKTYVGKTTISVRERHTRHLSDAFMKNSTFSFHAALRKYGTENFSGPEIIDSSSDPVELKEKEAAWIKTLGSFVGTGKGYNMLSCDTRIGVCEETRKRLSESRRGEKNPFFGKKHPPEILAKIQKTRSATISGPSYCGPPRKPLSDEAKRNISAAKIGKPGSRKGAKHSEETKRKMSENNPMRGRTGKKSPGAKWFIVTKPDGSQVDVFCLKEFCKKNGLSLNSINATMRRNTTRPFVRGWSARRAEK